jgi:hypothetical protein
MYFLGWFLVVFLPLGMIRAATPRLYFIALIPLFIIAGIGLKFLSKKYKYLGSVFLLFFVIFQLVSIYPVINFRHNYSGLKEYALFVGNITEPNAVIIENDNSVFLRYYANRSTLGFPYLGTRAQVTDTVIEIHTLLDNGIPVYVPGNILVQDEFETPKSTLLYNFELYELGTVLSEDYHHSVLYLKLINRTIYRIRKKENMTVENIGVYAYDD